MPDDELLDIGAKESFSTFPPPPEAVVIEEPAPGTSSNHHVGPIGESYIQDKRARQKSFSKRLKTFQKSAQLLNTMCGALVKFSMTSESGRQISASFPPIRMRHVARWTAGWPPMTHLEKIQQNWLKKTISFIPGKKEKKVLYTKKAVNKCAVCALIYNSCKDKLFKKKHRLKGEWLGCEKEGCDFWGHAICAKVRIVSRKKYSYYSASWKPSLRC